MVTRLLRGLRSRAAAAGPAPPSQQEVDRSCAASVPRETGTSRRATRGARPIRLICPACTGPAIVERAMARSFLLAHASHSRARLLIGEQDTAPTSQPLRKHSAVGLPRFHVKPGRSTGPLSASSRSATSSPRVSTAPGTRTMGAPGLLVTRVPSAYTEHVKPGGNANRPREGRGNVRSLRSAACADSPCAYSCERPRAAERASGPGSRPWPARGPVLATRLFHVKRAAPGSHTPPARSPPAAFRAPGPYPVQPAQAPATARIARQAVSGTPAPASS